MPDYFSLPVVSNTGPLLGLSRAGLGHLPAAIFPVVYLTQAIVDELRDKDRDRPDVAEVTRAISTAQRIELRKEPDPLLLAELDAGEASVIQAALELKIHGVLIDERKARRIAHTIYGLEVHGTGALLLEAKRRGLISEVKPALLAMISGGYFIGPRLFQECLSRADE
jgi:predicted nucleic acid-binding protein